MFPNFIPRTERHEKQLYLIYCTVSFENFSQSKKSLTILFRNLSDILDDLLEF